MPKRVLKMPNRIYCRKPFLVYILNITRVLGVGLGLGPAWVLGIGLGIRESPNKFDMAKLHGLKEMRHNILFGNFNTFFGKLNTIH